MAYGGQEGTDYHVDNVAALPDNYSVDDYDVGNHAALASNYSVFTLWPHGGLSFLDMSGMIYWVTSF